MARQFPSPFLHLVSDKSLHKAVFKKLPSPRQSCYTVILRGVGILCEMVGDACHLTWECKSWVLVSLRCSVWNVYNHGQKQLRHSLKKTCFTECTSFSISNFHVSTPSPLFNVLTTWQCPQSIFRHWKRGRGGVGYRQKRCSFEITEGCR